MRATGWRLEVPSARPAVPPASTMAPLPTQLDQASIPPEWQCGFLDAAEWRFTSDLKILAEALIKASAQRRSCG